MLEAFFNWFKRKARPASLPKPANTRTLSTAGLDLIKHFESCFLKAYDDGGGVWTIGWGHTGLKHEDGTVYPGRRITREKADELLVYDMGVFMRRVNELVTVPLEQHEYDALVSFNFNTGGLKGSTLLRLLNLGDREGAAEQFLRWNKDNGKVIAGLTRRRNAERAMFLGRDWKEYRA